MKVYCCQLDMVWENKAENFRKVETLLQQSQPERGSLFVLPEMFATGFSMNVGAISEEAMPGTDAFVQSIARKYKIYIVAGLVARGPDGRGLNQAVVVSPTGEELTRYSKIHPFTLGGELASYSRGDRICTFEWNGLKVTPFICYDLRFPEVFRTAAQQGTEMFVVIAAWPNRREQHWVTLLQARAIENLAYVIGVNRAGRDPQHVYPGHSMIVDPHGKALVEVGESECVMSADIAPEVVRNWRRDFPALADMHWRG